jgi:hypothetical protein
MFMRSLVSIVFFLVILFQASLSIASISDPQISFSLGTSEYESSVASLQSRSYPEVTFQAPLGGAGALEGGFRYSTTRDGVGNLSIVESTHILSAGYAHDIYSLSSGLYLEGALGTGVLWRQVQTYFSNLSSNDIGEPEGIGYLSLRLRYAISERFSINGKWSYIAVPSSVDQDIEILSVGIGMSL